jgi:competence protein ComEC
VAATAGILLLTPWLFGLFRKRMPVWLAALLSVSAAAQILCAPILLQLQSGIPTYSLIANALVEPLVAPITVLGIVACLASAFGFGLLATPISWLASLPAALVVSVVHNLSGLPLVTLWWPGGPIGTALLAFLALGALLLAKTSWRLLAKSIIATCGVTLLFVAGFGFFKSTEWPVKNWQVINCNVGQGDSLLIRSQDHFALVDVGRDAKPVKDCLDRLGVRKLDLLVLTHFDADHVGGLSGALDGRQVVEGMLTDFEDDRPQAQATANQLRAAANQTVRAFAGMNGRLGNVNWLVLQPELHGEGSEDPNDGSITMRWDSPEYTLFTMADLGEKGQMRLVQLHPSWISIDHRRPMLLKVSHHGSADQYPELIESLRPDLAIISVGKANPYGHPTARTLAILHRVGSAILRTDQDGAISVLANSRDGLTVGSGG